MPPHSPGLLSVNVMIAHKTGQRGTEKRGRERFPGLSRPQIVLTCGGRHARGKDLQ